jgi:tRNA G37 N-methylase TrmD
VPKVLRSGNHKEIKKWREEDSKKKTKNKENNYLNKSKKIFNLNMLRPFKKAKS